MLYVKCKLNLTQFLKPHLPLISGGVRAFPWRKGMHLRDWWEAGGPERTNKGFYERESSHLGREAQTVLHPSMSGKQLPSGICAMSTEAKSGERAQREPTGGRCRSCARRDDTFRCWLPAGHGHRAGVQIVSKHFQRLHLHPAAVWPAHEVSTKVRDRV